MCGIAGGYFFRNKNLTAPEFGRALQQLQQRGPDAEGIFEDEHVYLGHRRLSIIDTSADANQPFYDSSGRYVIVFNGEIFNYEHLKKTKLNSKAIQFKTHADTEVLLQLLIHYGPACLEWLSGFFAFAFYDRNQQEMIIARDRFGKKPLVLAEQNDSLLFASELKAIMPLLPEKKIDAESVHLFFQFNYLPPEQSILQNVRKLKPGTYIHIRENQLSEHQYYTLRIERERYSEYNYGEACNRLVTLMDEAVQQRMISDVPLGSFLSGGIDSSVVVALASRHTKQLKTFSIGYRDNPLFDETQYAKLVADKFGTDHRVFYLTEQDYKDEVFNVLDYLDEPFADNSCIPQYILCKRTREHVTVALSGDGGDEVFAGYNKHKAEYMVRNNRWMARTASIGRPILNRLPQNENTRIGNVFRKMIKLANGASLPDAERHIRWSSILSAQETSTLFNPHFSQRISQQKISLLCDEYARQIKSHDFNEILLTDMNLVLPGDMLHKVDMMSMANSVEVRSPFLDHRVVDFAFSLPAAYKINKHFKKRIVQDAFRNELPVQLYNRPKQGFDIPLLDWFRNDFNDYIFNHLLKKDFVEEQNIFSWEAITYLRQKLHSNSPGFVHATIWALISFQYWYRKFYLGEKN